MVVRATAHAQVAERSCGVDETRTAHLVGTIPRRYAIAAPPRLAVEAFFTLRSTQETAHGSVVVVVVVGKKVVVEASLLAEAVFESRLFRGARGDARVGERCDVAPRDRMDVVVVRVLHALTVVLAVALPVRSPVDGHEVGTVPSFARRPAGAGIGRVADILVQVGGTPATPNSPVVAEAARLAVCLPGTRKTIGVAVGRLAMGRALLTKSVAAIVKVAKLASCARTQRLSRACVRGPRRD